MRQILVLLILISATCWGEVWQDSSPGGFAVKIQVLPTTLKVDQLLDIDVELQYPEGYRPNLDEMKENLVDRQSDSDWGFTLSFEDIEPAVKKDNIFIQKIRYRLEPWLAGEHFLSFYTVTFYGETRGRDPVDFFTTIFNIKVEPPDEFPEVQHLTQGVMPLVPSLHATISAENRRRFLREEDKDKELAERNRRALENRALPWAWISLTIALALGAWISKKAWEKLRRRSGHSRSTKMDPRKQALQALDLLAAKQLPQKGDYETFYMELTSIVREFIEKHYQIRAPEQTTEEFLQELAQGTRFNQETQSLLKDFLLSADMVKFARLQPSLQDAEKANGSGRHFVEKSP